jgi:very-short-patch-repair endonuclease
MANQRARRLRSDMTDAEQALWRALRRRAIDGAQFRRQAPIGCYIVDFVCFERRLVVEIDGGQHADRMAEDQARTEWLGQQGFRVLRFWNNDVFLHLDGVLEKILEQLRA